MAKMTTVYWRDIPAQVIVKKGRESAKVMLSQRFQEAIDRAAMRAGKPGGRFILQNADFLEYGTPMANVEAFAATALENAWY